MLENKSVDEVLTSFSTSVENGLSEEEVKARQAKYGPNALAEKKKKGWFMTFIGEFKDPMVIVLFIAALISLFLAIFSPAEEGASGFELFEPYFEVIIIFAVVILNAVIGTVQEMKAEKALEALKEMSSPTATVKRGGKILDVKASELVPGDIVILEEGRTVPADLRLLKSFSMKADESSLTGESVPSQKDADITFSEEVGVGDRVNEVFMSTPIVYGRGEGVVIATGMNTEIGRIAEMLESGEEEMTPLQKKLAGLSKFLGYLTLGIVIVMLAVKLIYSGVRGVIATEWGEDLLDSVSLAVAAIPEGLPAVVTIVLALGMQKMAKVNTIVRRLASVETLGAVSYICSDKTGTLTENKMTVVGAYLPGKLYAREDLNDERLSLLAKGMCLCSNASIENGVYGDPTEVALVNYANSLGMSKRSLEEATPRINEYPFDSVRKMMSTLHDSKDGNEVVYTKGAMDQILKHCVSIRELDGSVRPITEKDIEDVKAASNEMAAGALRVLALAYREEKLGATKKEIAEENLVFVGLTGMVDPPRAAAKPAVATLRGAGITTVMITGDHVDTAFAIAKELGICSERSECMSGDEIDACTPEELQKRTEKVRVFARVSPENKVQIVKAIKANGHIAAMTGDGVNDAPSLKAADIGIAMGITGTDVAKGAADMVLADDNFASIEKAVEEGRGIYANIKKTILFLLSSNIGEVVAMFIAAVIGLDTPLIAIHLLWVNLVTDSLPAVALGSDKKPDDIMRDQPRDPKESLFAHGGWAIMFGYGIAIGLITLAAFLITPLGDGIALDVTAINNYFTAHPQQLEESQAMAFTVLAFSELFHMLGMTNVKKSFVFVFADPNKMLWLSFFIGLGLQFLVVETPGLNNFFSVYPLHDHPIDYLWVFLLAIVPLVIHEITVLVLWIKKVVSKAKKEA